MSSWNILASLWDPSQFADFATRWHRTYLFSILKRSSIRAPHFCNRLPLEFHLKTNKMRDWYNFWKEKTRVDLQFPIFCGCLDFCRFFGGTPQQDMKQKVHLVFASLFTDRAISYRHDRGTCLVVENLWCFNRFWLWIFCFACFDSSKKNLFEICFIKIPSGKVR